MGGIHLFYRWLIAPKSDNEDRARSERILNILLVASVLLTGIAASLASLDALQRGEAYRGVPLWSAWALCAFFVTLLLLSRKGSPRVASYLLLIAYLIVLAYATATWGTDLPWSLLAYPVVITMASVLLGTRASLVVTAVICAYLIFVSYLHVHGIWTPKRYWRTEMTSLSDTFVSVVLLLTITLVAWLSNRELERSLARTRRSEKALLEERDALEVRVEERTRELQVLQMEKMAQQNKFIEFGRLSAGFFHDLVTPLNAVSLHLEGLKRESPPGEVVDASQHIEQALHTAGRVERFLQEIRKRLAHQKTEEDFSLVEEAQSVLRTLEHKARKAAVELVLTAPETLRVHSCASIFSQLLANLVTNAIDSYDGVTLAPSLRTVHITLEEKGPEIILEVRDHGSGISPDVQEIMFRPFFTTKSPEKGTGIGLTVVQHIVERDLKGSLVVEQPEDGGTRIIVRFPRPAPPT